jgi:hypothetical protein
MTPDYDKRAAEIALAMATRHGHHVSTSDHDMIVIALHTVATEAEAAGYARGVAAAKTAMTALIAVAEDCAAHHLYITKGDAALAEFRKKAPGVKTSWSAGDHYRDAAEAIRAARAVLGSHVSDGEKGDLR